MAGCGALRRNLIRKISTLAAAGLVALVAFWSPGAFATMHRAESAGRRPLLRRKLRLRRRSEEYRSFGSASDGNGTASHGRIFESLRPVPRIDFNDVDAAAQPCRSSATLG